MPVQTISPTASSHDAWEAGTGVVTLTDEVKMTAGPSWGGLLLAAVTASHQATINSATLYYQASATSHDDPDIDWYLQAADTAAAFTTGASNISGRARTTAVTQDTSTAIGNTVYRSVNITSQVAEVKGRAGWVSGGNMALIADARSASCDIWLRSYDSGGSFWYVEINYTEPVGSGVPLKTIYYARLRG